MCKILTHSITSTNCNQIQSIHLEYLILDIWSCIALEHDEHPWVQVNNLKLNSVLYKRVAPSMMVKDVKLHCITIMDLQEGMQCYCLFPSGVHRILKVAHSIDKSVLTEIFVILIK